MSGQLEKQARTEAMLGEAAELALMLARDLAVRARQCEDNGETVALVEAFQKTTRAMRLTLALDAQLTREAARDAKDAARDAQTDAASAARDAQDAARAAARAVPPSAVEQRKARVRNLLKRILWTESEGDEETFDVLTEDLDARLHEAARSDDFEALPIEVLAQRVIADMGLDADVTLSLCEPARPAHADTG